MAPTVLTDVFVEIDGNDVSDHITGVQSRYLAELLDDTVMGDDTRSRIGGLKDWSFTLNSLNDWAASELDSILFPLVGTTFTITVRKDKTAGVGATNPNFTGTCILEGYSPVQGGVGELGTTDFTCQAAGTLSRATS